MAGSVPDSESPDGTNRSSAGNIGRDDGEPTNLRDDLPNPDNQNMDTLTNAGLSDVEANNPTIEIQRESTASPRAAKRMQTLETACFCFMILSSFGIIGTSKPAEKHVSLALAFSLLYISWGGSTAGYLLLDWSISNSRMMNTLSHACCSIASLYFFCSILKVSTPLALVPMCVNFGLLASVGVQHISPAARDNILGYMAGRLSIPYTRTTNNTHRVP